MKKIVEWIRQHQILAFFIIVYAVAWPGFLLVYFIFPGNDAVEILSTPIVQFSPALTAMLISGLVDPQPKSRDRKPRRIAFILSWLVAAPIMILHAWNNMGVDLAVAIIILGLMALFPAWVISSVYSRTPGIRKMFSTLLKPRGPAIWYLVIFLIFPGFVLLAFYLTPLFGGESQFYLAGLGFGGASFFLFLEFSSGFFYTGGINEESGWRGFALPRLQKRYPVIVASLLLGFLWSFWHIPYDIGRGVRAAWILENRLLWTPLFGIIMTWLYNRTNGSLLAPALFHPAMNAFGNYFKFIPVTKAMLIVLTIFVIVSDRMWEKLPSDHLAVYQTPALGALEASDEPGKSKIIVDGAL